MSGSPPGCTVALLAVRRTASLVAPGVWQGERRAEATCRVPVGRSGGCRHAGPDDVRLRPAGPGRRLGLRRTGVVGLGGVVRGLAAGVPAIPNVSAGLDHRLIGGAGTQGK